MLTVIFFSLIAVFIIIIIRLYGKNTGLLKKFYKFFPEYEGVEMISYLDQYIFILSREKMAFLGFEGNLETEEAAKNPILTSVEKILDYDVIKDGESSKKFVGEKVGNLLFPTDHELAEFILGGESDAVSELKINFTIGENQITFKLIDREMKKNSDIFKQQMKLCLGTVRRLRELEKK